MRERRKRAEDANRICGITHENAENKGLSLVEAEMGNSCIKMSRSCSACGKDGTKTTSSTRSCVPRQDVKRWSTSADTKMHTRVPREVCLRETGKAPLKTGWAETDKGQPGKPNVRARLVAKEYKTHARPELCASTPLLEALNIVLSGIATGEREGKVLALVDVRSAYFHAPSRPRTPSRVTNTRVRDAAQNWEEELASTLSGLGLTRRSACPCVWRGPHQDGGCRGDRTRRRHTQTSRRAGEHSTVSLFGTVMVSQLRQIRGMSER